MDKPEDIKFTPHIAIEPFLKVGAITENAIEQYLEEEGAKLDVIERTLFELRLAQLRAAKEAMIEKGVEFVKKLDDDVREKVAAALNEEMVTRIIELLADGRPNPFNLGREKNASAMA